MVLVRYDNVPSDMWRLGHVVHPDIDQIVRVVSIKSNGEIIKRPFWDLIQKDSSKISPPLSQQ